MAHEGGGHAKRALLVDDNPAVLFLLSAMLEGFGFQVDAAPGGRRGLAAAEQRPYDIILLDMRMADIDGLAVIRSIRAGHGPNRLAPILAVTGDNSPAQIALQMAAGATARIGKPFSVAELEAAVGAVLHAAADDGMRATG